MQKSIVNAVFAGAVLILAFFVVALGLRRSDGGRYDRTFVWTVDHDEGSGRDLLVRGENVKVISRDINKLAIAFNRQVRSVSFVFPGGDHAVPGAYTRESFADYQIVADR